MLTTRDLMGRLIQATSIKTTMKMMKMMRTMTLRKTGMALKRLLEGHLLKESQREISLKL
jgi:hypothetical protein